MRDYQKYATILAVFTAALYLALIVAAFGLVSLATDTDVVTQPDAGPLVGPGMAGAAVLLVFVLLLVLGVNTPPERQRIAVGFAVGTGLGAVAAFVVAGAVLYAVGEGESISALTFASSMLLGPYAAATGILAFIVVLVYSWILAARVGEHGRPLWPWERRGE
ncbi:DUF6121 family protein [Cryobacterium tagatosivorans]|uniref:Uncharacterized protein n=1 Tax=Cryobacterium tagatosivorans TaxID=1259199 RepID=A0A4R8UE33_9MICO|nr:DUF6121 family protein [Cryobacterium tagatosivorans]TFB48438.1 hypothetical protein E3O23_13295 [Cryobacterium tagatosivorans]